MGSTAVIETFASSRQPDHGIHGPRGVLISRRRFINAAGRLTLAAGVAANHALPAAEQPKASASKLPRWRGFNLLEKFYKQRGSNPPFQEQDFAVIKQWGFDFVRLPMSYHCWSDPREWLVMDENQLKHVDAAVELGRQYQVHVNLNLHRAPGYCVNPPAEPLSLWKDEPALEACAQLWGHFAKRYKGISNEGLSFDLLNEPPNISEETYVRVAKRLVEAIRAEDPARLIIADGLLWGTAPVEGLIPLQVAQSTRGYEPMRITHFKASWIQGSDKWETPTWPLELDGKTMDRETLRRDRIEKWKKLEARGVGVHVGEWGAFNRTPHDVVLAWMRDCLALWKDAGWGWALWNLRGAFGVLDSERKDLAYEDFRGHKLDRKMLELLRAF